MKLFNKKYKTWESMNIKNQHFKKILSIKYLSSITKIYRLRKSLNISKVQNRKFIVYSLKRYPNLNLNSALKLSNSMHNLMKPSNKNSIIKIIK